MDSTDDDSTDVSGGLAGTTDKALSEATAALYARRAEEQRRKGAHRSYLPQRKAEKQRRERAQRGWRPRRPVADSMSTVLAVIAVIYIFVAVVMVIAILTNGPTQLVSTPTARSFAGSLKEVPDWGLRWWAMGVVVLATSFFFSVVAGLATIIDRLSKPRP